jgi:hypothetical protein
MPPNYNIQQSDAIELLAPLGNPLEDQHKRPDRRHSRSDSTSSFIHFRAPQQREEDLHVISNGNKLASQVNCAITREISNSSNDILTCLINRHYLHCLFVL